MKARLLLAKTNDVANIQITTSSVEKQGAAGDLIVPAAVCYSLFGLCGNHPRSTRRACSFSSRMLHRQPAPSRPNAKPPNASKNSISRFLLSLLNIHVFCIHRQGAEGLSAVLIEVFKELQALEPQVMDVAAQQIQREVQAFPAMETMKNTTTLPGMRPRC